MELDLALLLCSLYKSGWAAPSDVVAAVYERIAANSDPEI
jgi:hypothetical protein